MLKTEDTRVQAHKVVLAAYSASLEAMFQVELYALTSDTYADCLPSHIVFYQPCQVTNMFYCLLQIYCKCLEACRLSREEAKLVLAAV